MYRIDGQVGLEKKIQKNNVKKINLNKYFQNSNCRSIEIFYYITK